jgi:hypothetical protein
MIQLLEKMFDSFHKPELGVIIEDEVTIWGQVGTTSGITIEQAVSYSGRELQNQ